MENKRWERKLQTLVVLLLALGTATAAAAWQRGREPSREAMETPGTLEGWRILVDAGHGGYDGGAQARDSGIWEKHLNLAVALEVEKSLAARGATVIMTRRDDEDLCEEEQPAGLTKKRQDMQARVALARENGADMVLSIHMNQYRDRRESGPQVFYRRESDAGRLLAGCLQESLVAGLAPRKERSALSGDYFILQLEVPSALVECGFISNPAEEKLLLTPDYQHSIAEAVAAGVEQYVSLRPRLSEAPAEMPPAGEP